MAKAEAYKNTKVKVEVTQHRDITGLFAKYDVQAWNFGVDKGQAIAMVRFKMKKKFWVRVTIKADTTDMTAKQAEQSERVIWRVLYNWLKTQFEAIEYNVFKMEEAFLPWLEIAIGREVVTVAEAMLPRLDDMPKLLGSGGSG